MNALRPISCLALAAVIFAPAVLAQQAEEPPLAAATPRPRKTEDLAAETVVVFNENDRDSTALAGLYAEKRGIPPKNLVALKCPRTEEITRKDYDDTIAKPLREAFEDRGFWKLLKEPTAAGRVSETKIRFVALIQGIPLRVSATAGEYEGDNTTGNPKEIYSRNECSVDSEVAVLGLWSKQISGVLLNPYFRETKVAQDTELPSQLLVCRLDGPSPAIVRRMIDDSLATEAEGLRGFTYIDAQGLAPGPLQMGDKWFHSAAKNARENGIPVVMDNGPALFPDLYPMRHAAVYLGWYSEHVAGPFTRENFRFQRGAVALHLHSFSAVTLRDRRKNWCAPLLASGAAATLGNVYEPYLGLTPQPDIFAQRLREGFTFAEACSMSVRALSWMTTFVGDPLYRPYLNLKDDPKNEWDAYRLGVRTWLSKNRPAGEAELREATKKLSSGIVSESMGLLELFGKDNGAALEAFREARRQYPEADDRIRVALHEAGVLVATKGNVEAAKFLREQAATNGGSDKAVLLSALAASYGTPATPPAAKKKATPPAPKKP